MNEIIKKCKKNRVMIQKNRGIGKIIVVEGNDGAGKSTIVRYLSKYFNGVGRRNIIIKFNMSYITLKSIKKGKSLYFGPYTNTLIHAASIIDQFERYAIRELQKGSVIICDRYLYSVVARGLVRGVDKKAALSLLEWCFKPDLVIYLDI